MKKMDKLSAIYMCIVNDLKAIEELTYHLNKLQEMYEAELKKQEEENND